VTRYIWGEREGGRRVGGAIGGTAAAAECPLRAACKGRGQGRGQRCVQSQSEKDACVHLHGRSHGSEKSDA
jgi:hypothetical protein